MANCSDKNVPEQIKTCFRKFDVDGNGMISKHELRNVLQALCRKNPILTEEEINVCMAEADKNGNGVIEYDEFVDWLLQPGARLQASDDGPSLFDVQAALRPLFDVFDKNGDGTVSVEEFKECHTILQNALMLSPKKKGCPTNPKMLSACADELYQRIDQDKDAGIGFDEFVQWQRESFARSGLMSGDIKDLVPALARQLKRIFKFMEEEATGKVKPEDEALLQRVIKNVASFSRDIWNEESAAHNSVAGKVHYTNTWCKPPPGLNIQRLKCQHLAYNPRSVNDLANTMLNIVCVPELEKEGSNKLSRRWFAKVSNNPNSNSDNSDNGYYMYRQLRWERADEQGAVFEESFAQFPPEMKFFLILKTEANFGADISWNQLQQALGVAVALGLITEEQHRRFNSHMEARVIDAARVKQHLPASPTDNERQRALQATKHIVLPCRTVISNMLELRLLEISTKLADCLNA
mmetsp:Transcript_92047/g.260565  ORF Transcript_92047/g.260565 Transcript_92047/m.260565 type:complete len:466 (-) Transcript_92047:171-1568(-)